MVSNQTILILFLLFNLLGCKFSWGLVITSGLEARIINTPKVTRFNPNDSWEIIDADLVYWKDNSTGLFPENTVVLTSLHDSYSPDKFFNLLRNRNPVGIILMSFNPGPAGLLDLTFNQINTLQLEPLPTVSMSIEESSMLVDHLKEGTSITVDISSDDSNPWHRLMGQSAIARVLQQIAIMLWSFINVGICIKKITSPSKLAKLPTILLGLEILGNSIRGFYFTLDPPFCPLLIFPYFIDMILVTITWAISLDSMLLITLYWYGSLKTIHMYYKSMLGYFQVPFIVISGLLVVGELVIGVLRGLYINIGILGPVSGLFYLGMNLVLSVMFLVTGSRVFSKLKKLERVTSDLSSMTLYLVASSFFSLMFALAMVSLTMSFYWIPTWFFITWSLIWVSLSAKSTFQILAISGNTTGKTKDKSNGLNGLTRTPELSSKFSTK
eukprot:TRINITY_DN6712_c0_g1_i1.p1 TRINITY_DN6712_c0_g1~~TRINITY_DN6712_c0_g1_i1.p1  ORF type:complete len:440 (-),score=39.89 TRINITY_DN6712_c0_g1_i1:95-1414(-)